MTGQMDTAAKGSEEGERKKKNKKYGSGGGIIFTIFDETAQ